MSPSTMHSQKQKTTQNFIIIVIPAQQSLCTKKNSSDNLSLLQLHLSPTHKATGRASKDCNTSSVQ